MPHLPGLHRGHCAHAAHAGGHLPSQGGVGCVGGGGAGGRMGSAFLVATVAVGWRWSLGGGAGARPGWQCCRLHPPRVLRRLPCLVVKYGCKQSCACAPMGPLASPSQLQVFIPEHRWGPMSHLPLAQESMREMLTQLTQAVSLPRFWPARVFCFAMLLLPLSACLPHTELLHCQRRLHVHDFACGATPAPLH